MTPDRRLTATAPGVLAWEPLALRAPGAGEALVRTRLSAVSVASELSRLRDGPFPAPLDYQTLGVVEEVGKGAELAVGQRVFSTAGHVSAGLHRTEILIPVPDHVPDRVALAAILGEETHKGIRRVAPQPGEHVLVAGAGLLGLLCVYNLTRRGIREVEVLEPDPERRDLARRFGARGVWAPGRLGRCPTTATTWRWNAAPPPPALPRP